MGRQVKIRLVWMVEEKGRESGVRIWKLSGEGKYKMVWGRRHEEIEVSLTSSFRIVQLCYWAIVFPSGVWKKGKLKTEGQIKVSWLMGEKETGKEKKLWGLSRKGKKK